MTTSLFGVNPDDGTGENDTDFCRMVNIGLLKLVTAALEATNLGNQLFLNLMYIKGNRP